MKKMILSLMLVLSSLTLAPKPEANAGLLIGLAAGNLGKGAAIGAISSTAIMGGIAGGFAIAALVSGEKELLMGTGWTIVGAAFIIPAATLLDVSPGPSADSLLQALKEKYPFINSIEALSNLTTSCKKS